MKDRTAQVLIELDSAFYAEHAKSFSATRSAPWDGWRRVAEETLPRLVQRRAPRQAAQGTAATTRDGALQTTQGALQMLDVACGNLRFEKYLAGRLLDGEGAQPPAPPAISVCAVDNCAALMSDDSAGWDRRSSTVIPYERDILSSLAAGADPLAGFPAADLTVCFGFMHHVPSHDLRQRLIELLVQHTVPGGFVALSFWRFMDDSRLARKTRQAEARAALEHAEGRLELDPAALEAGDHLLGWQDDASAFRYCHHVDEAELDALTSSLPAEIAREVARFSADGRSGRLNRYLILERR